eukprot:gene8604-9481_t
MSAAGDSVYVDISGFVRPSTANRQRAPPGGRTSIVFGDEYTIPTSPSSLSSSSSSSAFSPRRLSTDTRDSYTDYGTPSRTPRAADRTSMHSVLDFDANASRPSESRRRARGGAVGGNSNIIFG